VRNFTTEAQKVAEKRTLLCGLRVFVVN